MKQTSASAKRAIDGLPITRFTTASTTRRTHTATPVAGHACWISGGFRRILKSKTMASFPNRWNRCCNRVTVAVHTNAARHHVVRIVIPRCPRSRPPLISKLTRPAQKVAGDGNRPGTVSIALSLRVNLRMTVGKLRRRKGTLFLQPAPPNKSLDASGITSPVIDNLSVTWLSPAASTQPLGG